MHNSLSGQVWAGAWPRLKGHSQPSENVLCKRLKSASLWLIALLLLCLLGLSEQGFEAMVMTPQSLCFDDHWGLRNTGLSSFLTPLQSPKVEEGFRQPIRFPARPPAGLYQTRSVYLSASAGREGGTRAQPGSLWEPAQLSKD